MLGACTGIGMFGWVSVNLTTLWPVLTTACRPIPRAPSPGRFSLVSSSTLQASNPQGGNIMEISSTSKMLAGVILVMVPTIEYGGAFLLGMLRSGATGYVDNALRHDLFRAGHAHAGVMVLFSVICQFLADGASLPDWLTWIARLGAPCAAILMPLGFFLSATSPRVSTPTRMIWLVYAGAAILAVATLVLGIGLIRAAFRG